MSNYNQSLIEDYRQTIERLQKECTEKTNAIIALGEQLKAEEQECEELKKQLMQKSEVDMFFNTPIEGWSNDPCGTCPHKAENEELKEEILTKNEKIKELRLSVSDLTNRLCYLNTEKSFRIVDLEQALNEIIEVIKKLNGESIITIPDFSKEENYKLIMKQCNEGYVEILNIINKAKGESNAIRKYER